MKTHCSGYDPTSLQALASARPEARREMISQLTRRHFLGGTAKAIGSAALAGLLQQDGYAAPKLLPNGGLHFAPKAKRVISLFMAGAPSQLETWDYKPDLVKYFDKDLPESIRDGQVLTGMTASQARLPVAPSRFSFSQQGKSGRWVSELFPNIGKVVDELAVIYSMQTDAINHEPAILFMSTGVMIPGRPCLGSWLSYGLGRMNEDLPAFVVLTSKLPVNANIQALSSRLWSSGYLSPEHAGVALRAGGDPVLYLSDPAGMTRDVRRAMIDGVNEVNHLTSAEFSDPETEARISQYEMAFRMQASVPELTDLSKESQRTWDLYGPKAKEPGTYAYNCLMARRMAERNVRCIQVYERGWDAHNDLPNRMKVLCEDVDRPTYALITELKERGLLDETLVMWGGEFGRTVYSQGGLTAEKYGRDHHPRCFSMWMAGGGIKGGASYGATDEFSYNIIQDPTPVRDLNATILHLLGVDHERLTFRFQGLEARLTGVIPAKVIKPLLA